MSDIHQVIRDIRARKNLKENLSLYREMVFSDAAAISYPDLSFRALTLYESVLERGGADPLMKDAAACLRGFLNGEPKLQDVILLRTQNTQRMETVSSSIDLYVLLEYLLNRVEHRFEGEKALPEDYNDLGFTEEVMNYLALKKGEARGIAVSEILQQLPVRMTKERFIEILSERLSVYRASDTGAFEGMLSLLRGAAGLAAPEASYAPYEELLELKGYFAGPDFQTITEEKYFDLKTRLQKISDTLQDDSERCSDLAAVLNNLEVMILCGIRADDPTYESTFGILRGVTTLMEALPEENPELLSEVNAQCEALEGVLEDALEKYRESSAFTEDFMIRFRKEIEEAGLEYSYGNLRMIQDLRSDSLYAPEMSDRKAPQDLSEEVFISGLSELIRELRTLFAESGRNYTRAVMGRMFSVLPPVFKTQEELENYIFASLSSCRNTEEKLACVELIRKLMEQ